ncbi:equilibrative nucleoside transporter 4-like isoform X1 [Pomacea canaliculata]|uniref:equilibrative nucleoside transporter 4-like isoform X1 n=1 Tax=Pomacea canaliculata TaxID=400727 RepID=UPI000D73F134|nr:equilibrative nucleoside transporter 4-like isoform X1 [Pomacea canaliculata]
MDENLSRGYCQLNSPPQGRRKQKTSGTRDHITPPRDPCSCVYLALVLAGAGFLLPYNSFITAVDYYQKRYPGSTIVFDMSLTYIVVAFVSVIINNALIEVLRMPVRITFGYILSFITLMCIALCDLWFELFPADIAYRVTLTAVGVVAVGSTVQQSSFYGYTSMLPSRYTQAVMTGESLAGVLVSANRILTKALLNDERINTIIFFCVSIGILLACFVVFHVARRSNFVKFYVMLCAATADNLDHKEKKLTSQLSYTEDVSLVDFQDQESNQRYGVLVIHSPSEVNRAFQPPEIAGSGDRTGHRPSQATSMAGCDEETCLSQVSEVTFTQSQSYKIHVPKVSAIKRGLLTRYEVSRSVWPYMLSICLAYFVTLCLFPGIESEVVSCTLGTWMPVIMMAAFNLSDVIGKILASIPCDWPPGRLLLCTFCRVLCVPLLMLCASPRLHPVIAGEAWPIVFSLVLGLSNGYFGSVPIILAPEHVPDEQREICGNIMTLSYSLGLTTGSAAAYLLDYWLGPVMTIDPCAPAVHNVTSSLVYQSSSTVGPP